MNIFDGRFMLHQGFLLGPPSLLSLLLLLRHAHQMQDVAQVDEAGGGDEDDLQHPEADVGDGEGFVITDVLAAWLLGVTGEARLFVPPDFLGSCPQDKDTENEQDSEPDLPHHRGVLLSTLQKPPQQVPVTHECKYRLLLKERNTPRRRHPRDSGTLHCSRPVRS
ncbi:uracil phosphoribosyltransferase-like protein [Platysternon megacephalum]|uniref:Uracil phosphoribosyltransferase-like protein n=1 Tax=Platysternon megacephalum TaxID=55544 RepID=A0A4D9F0Z9_9SAUR|nr:uracil phosphoribosyltransferase-like protein [Platysternon megacephalum]